MRNLALLLLVCISASADVKAQDVAAARINMNFVNVKPAVFFTELEKQVPCKFYYDIEKLDSVTVSLTASNMALKDVLTEAFKGTDIHFSFARNNVFITRGLTVVTDLPQNIFQPTAELATKTMEMPRSALCI